MKTREEIEQEFIDKREAVWALAKAKHQNNEVQYRANAEAITDAELADLDALAAARDAALAELDDPMARNEGGRVTIDVMTTMCERCGAVASPITLVVGVKDARWTLRIWGGDQPGSICLCADCIWHLEKVAGDAVAADLNAATGRTDDRIHGNEYREPIFALPQWL